ncbi:hypothetical protein [Halorientalis halophila]|uniref:hypothetical protein n=1 Tax=Halorientalis halophila TaxID=3108499 RepID=UPI00300B5F2C
MASLHHATLSAVLTFLVVVSSGAGLIPGSGASTVGEQEVTAQSDAIEALQSVDSYRTYTNVDVAVGSDRAFSNVTAAVNRSMGAAAVSTADGNETTYVVDGQVYRPDGEDWQTEPVRDETTWFPARQQIELLNESRVADVSERRDGTRTLSQVSLVPENRTLAAMLVAQPNNGIDSAESVTITRRSYDLLVNASTDRLLKVEMTLDFRHDGDRGWATMVTWFSGYNRTTPTVPADLQADAE